MDVLSVCPLRVGSVLWQPRRGAHTLTVVCKATYHLAPGEASLAGAQEPPREEDGHVEAEGKSLYAPGDLVPFKPRADVVLVGHAIAPAGEPVRSLLVWLVAGAVDKEIEVFGERSWAPDGRLLDGTTFTRMALSYDRAAGGPDTANPAGVPTGAAGRPDVYGYVALPNLQSPGRTPASRGETMAPIGFGPVAAGWSARRARLGSAAPRWSDRGWQASPLPDNFDFAYFNLAPEDQQVDAIADNERIVLQNLHAEHPRLLTRLPGLHPRAFVQRGRGAPRGLALKCDTLFIDADRALCTLTWRGQISLDGPDEPGRVLVGMEKPGERLDFEDVERLAPGVEDPETDERPARGSPAPELRGDLADHRAQGDAGDHVRPGLLPAELAPPGAGDRRSQAPPPPDARGSTPAPAPEPRAPRRFGPRQITEQGPTTARLPDDLPPTALPFRKGADLETTQRSRLFPASPRPADPDDGPPTPQPPAPVPAARPSPSRAPRNIVTVMGIEQGLGATPTWLAPRGSATAQPSSPGSVPPPAPVGLPPPGHAGGIAPPSPVGAIAPPPMVTSGSAMLSPIPGGVAPLPPLAHSPWAATDAAGNGAAPALPGATVGTAAVTGARPAVPFPDPERDAPSPRRAASPSVIDRPAPRGLVAASNAAAGAAARADVPPARASEPRGPRRADDAPVSPTSDRARLAPGESLQLLWFDPAAAPAILARWSGATPDADPELALLDALVAAEPVAAGAFEDALSTGAGTTARFRPPLVAAAGELRFPFDELETLKATVTAVTPLIAGDKKLREAVDTVNELLRTPWLQSSSGIADKLTQRLKDAFAQGNRILPASYLDAHTERILLEQRHYQKRTVLGEPRLRALLTPPASDEAVPTYLPAALATVLPMFQSIKVRLIAEAQPQQDQYEEHPLALRVLALARVVSPRRKG